MFAYKCNHLINSIIQQFYYPKNNNDKPKWNDGCRVVYISQSSPQSLHQISSNWLDMFIQKFWLQIVHAEFQSTQALTY